MRCEYGYCIVCDKEIASKCGHCATRKPNASYTQVLVPWSNGSKMTVAVCTECCNDKIWKADKKELTQAIWDEWDKMGHVYDKDAHIV